MRPYEEIESTPSFTKAWYNDGVTPDLAVRFVAISAITHERSANVMDITAAAERAYQKGCVIAPVLHTAAYFIGPDCNKRPMTFRWGVWFGFERGYNVHIELLLVV